MTSYALESKNDTIYLRHCGPLDATTLILWADSNLHKDYYFKRGHWQELLRSPAVQVYAIAWTPTGASSLQQIVGIAILGHHSTLFNLYLDPYWRQQGLGTLVIETLSPQFVRAKTDTTAGDPTPFYEKLGYRTIQEAKGKHGNIRVMQRTDLPSLLR